MSIVGLWISRSKGPTKNLGSSLRIRYAWGRKRSHGTILLIPTFLREEVTRTVRATIIFTEMVGEEEEVRWEKLSRRRISNSRRVRSLWQQSQPSSPSPACACIMHAQRRCEKNVLAAAKRGMVVLSLCMQRYQAWYTICKCAYRYRGSRYTQLYRQLFNCANQISCHRVSCMKQVVGRQYGM